jgi:hypothetical protein
MTAVAAGVDQTYQQALARAGEVLRKQGEVQPFDEEWLVRRGNYYTIITPDIAKRLLDRNLNNRPPKRRAINNYKRDMEAGEWNPDASDIKVGRNGELQDGQNRLIACIEANAPFPTLLRTGLDPEAKDHMDQGVRRTAADTFRMHAVAYPSDVAAAVNLRSRYEGLVRERQGRLVNAKSLSQTHQEAKDYLAEHPHLVTMTPLAMQAWEIGPAIAKSVYVAAFSTFAESSEKMAREFAERFIDGKVSGTGDPLLALSRYCMGVQRNKQGNPGTRGRHVALKHMLAMVRAWNAWVANEELARIVVRDTDILEAAV